MEADAAEELESVLHSNLVLVVVFALLLSTSEIGRGNGGAEIAPDFKHTHRVRHRLTLLVLGDRGR